MELQDPRDLDWCTLPYDFTIFGTAFDKAMSSWLRSLSREAEADTQRQSGPGFESQESA